MKSPVLLTILLITIIAFNGLLHYRINNYIDNNFESIKNTNVFVRSIEDDLDNIRVDNEIMSFVVCYTINEFDSLKTLKRKCEKKIDFILEKMDEDHFIKPVLIDSSFNQRDSAIRIPKVNIIIKKKYK